MRKKKPSPDQPGLPSRPQDKRSQPPPGPSERARVPYDGDLSAGDEGIDDSPELS